MKTASLSQEKKKFHTSLFFFSYFTPPFPVMEASAEVLQQLAPVLASLQSPDNNQRYLLSPSRNKRTHIYIYIIYVSYHTLRTSPVTESLFRTRSSVLFFSTLQICCRDSVERDVGQATTRPPPCWSWSVHCSQQRPPGKDKNRKKKTTLPKEWLAHEWPAHPQLRSQCSVLLRRLAFRPSVTSPDTDARLYDTVQEQTRSAIKDLLLAALANETDVSARHKVSDTIAEIAKSDLADGSK